MSNEIYNEGRVVGYSAEELFDKLYAEQHSDETPPTTKEWLSSSMGMGASFALHINKTTTSRSVISYNLPKGYANQNNNLYGLSGRYLIVATPIFGTATTAGSGQISAITEFSNIDSSVNSADTSEYSKILNGVVVYGSTNTTIKLLVDGACTCDVLFTGFLNSKILDVLKLSAGAPALGKTYTDIDDFGDSLLPDISQIFFARPTHKDYFTANVVNASDTEGSLIDISQVSNNSSTQSTSNSIITPSSVHYSNMHGKDVSGSVPNVFSVQQHTNGSTKINPSLYFYNPATHKLEPIDSDAKGAVNIIKRITSPAETEAQLKSRIESMTAANADKIFIGAWVETSTPNVIEYLIFPGNSEYFESLGDLLRTLKASGKSSFVSGGKNVRIYAQEPPAGYTIDTSKINYGIWD